MDIEKIRQFIKNKKVLITGHTGFVGAWLCVILDYFGADVIGFSLQEEEGSLYEKIKNNIKIKSYYGDIVNIDELEKCMDENRPEIVIHNAAFVFILKCEKDPYQTYATNVMGTVNLLEIIRKREYVRHLIGVSSDKVYKNLDNEKVLFSETDALDGGEPYSCSKTCQDLIIQSYYNTYFKQNMIGVSLFRPSNMIGGGDHNKIRLIPSIINSIKNNETLELRNPAAIRPWQDILDVMDAYLNVLIHNWGKGKLNIYNLGPTEENICSVLEIVKIIENIKADRDRLGIVQAQTDNIEKTYLGLSIDKIKENEAWMPRKGLEESLRDLYSFYENDMGYNAYELMIKDIKSYYQVK
ncbi:CDP-glucose 4,6-dehydratase [Lachnospiraceae bacterium 10-1]|nr:CDP-glucose 4,6-dehydratase [Lachnospiraceae bacterium 10-1]